MSVIQPLTINYKNQTLSDMKQSIFSMLFLMLTFTAFTQNAPSNDYKNWIVDLSQAQSSFEGIRIDKVELNDQYTVVHMSFKNFSFGDQHIEACNSFHIRSNGKKIARFVKAENIPTRDIYATGFSCADESSAMRIKGGQFVRFRIFFTRIPYYLNKIDVVEYTGEEACEFDVWNLNISRKEPISEPQMAAVTPKTPVKKPVNKNTVKQPIKKKPSNQPPLIASKSVDTPQSKPQNSISESNKPQVTPPEKREVKVVKEYALKRKTVQLEIWDNDQEDGDVVSVMLNNRWILRGVKVTKSKIKVEIPLSEGINKLVFHADNLGTAPPNTAAVSFWDSEGLQTIILNSDMRKSEAIRFIRN